jgi:ribokinase
MTAVVVVGSCNLDFIVEVPELPLAGQTVLGGDVVSRPGGKGANQAVAAKRLGAETTFIGAIGDDQFGTTLRAALAREDIDLSQLVVTTSPTGVALIVVDEMARNLITVAPGANRHLEAQHLSALHDTLGPGSVLLLQLEIPLPTCVAAAGIARDTGASVVVNAAPLTDPGDPDLELLLALTDVLIVNEGEALTLRSAASPPACIEDWLALVSESSDSEPPAVIVTLGGSGAVAAEHGTSFHVPAYQVGAVDTTGAGDAFCGAVAAALAEKRSLSEAVRRGCAAGALATTAVGAQSALPRTAELESLARQGGG